MPHKPLQVDFAYYRIEETAPEYRHGKWVYAPDLEKVAHAQYSQLLTQYQFDMLPAQTYLPSEGIVNAEKATELLSQKPELVADMFIHQSWVERVYQKILSKTEQGKRWLLDQLMKNVIEFSTTTNFERGGYLVLDWYEDTDVDADSYFQAAHQTLAEFYKADLVYIVGPPRQISDSCQERSSFYYNRQHVEVKTAVDDSEKEQLRQKGWGLLLNYKQPNYESNFCVYIKEEPPWNE